MIWAFSDESERAATMLVGVLLVPAGAVAIARQELRGLLLPGQRQVHTAKESDRRRRLLLDVVAGLDATAVVYRYRRPVGVNRIEARAKLLAAAADRLVTVGVTSWTLDSQDPAQAARDRHLLDRQLHDADARVVYDHKPAPAEPLLWLSMRSSGRSVPAVVGSNGSGISSNSARSSPERATPGYSPSGELAGCTSQPY